MAKKKTKRKIKRRNKKTKKGGFNTSGKLIMISGP